MTKPLLIVHSADLTETAAALCRLLATCDELYDRGVPISVITPVNGGVPSVTPLSHHDVVRFAHRKCQPVIASKNGRQEITLPDRVAHLCLSTRGEWGLRPLAGISTAPLLSGDGAVRTESGYDPRTQLFCVNVPRLLLPEQPTFELAFQALRLLRHTFRTFPYADAKRTTAGRIEVVDLDQPPENDESAFLTALLTACARPSLWIAPGVALTAPAISGAGTGKGLLARSICAIAYGAAPRAFTPGGSKQELEKRISAELMEAHPCLFLDNANGIALQSDTLASVITERPSRVRLLGKSEMVTLNATALIIITGNGLTLTEDLLRRFINCQLDAHCEDPESRPFPAGFLNQIVARRIDLLAAAFTILRWGRQNSASLDRGKPLGGFELWADWCRDPLITLGCRDPVERIAELKAADPGRTRTAEIFTTWAANHGEEPVKASEIVELVQKLLDPQGRGRQFVVTQLQKLVGTRVAGYTLTVQQAAGKWGPATYSLKRTV